MIVIAALAYGAYWFLDARFYETTDDAYVGGNIVAVTSRENATVLALHADNTQTVQRGQLLMEMDPAVAECEYGGGGSQSGARGAHGARRILHAAEFQRAAGAGRRWRWRRRKAIISAASRPPPTARCRARNWPMPATCRGRGAGRGERRQGRP